MQRVRAAEANVATPCVGCGTTSLDERCTHCGVAKTAGPYVITQVLARSQHGAMYLAEDGNGAKVALKELVFSLVPTTQELDAFLREGELLQALSHPRIPKFLRSFTLGQGVSTRLYLAQQYLPGVSLTQRLETEHFDESSVLAIARQALEVLGYLHSRSPVVVHRDVKPDNFIIDAKGALSLVDFGAARSVKAAGTHRATLVGTFGYMAPEQLGGTVDARSDLYGLGATLVHLLTRLPPERMIGPGMTLDFQKHVNVSTRTERFLSLLVATRPDARFSSAEEALTFLDGKTVAPPREFPRRAALVMAAGVALLAGSAAFLSVRSKVDQTTTVESRPDPVKLPPVALPERAPTNYGNGAFDWVLGRWNFNKPGHWVLDESGHNHHALLPTTGFTNEFFGLLWDGTQDLTTADSKDFTPTGRFEVIVDFSPSKEALTKPVTLISRGDPNGKFSWAVRVIPTSGVPLVRFSIADDAGHVSSVEGPLLGDSDRRDIHASFDPRTGTQRITVSCTVVGSTVTLLRPARELPEGSLLHLITGFRGDVDSIELTRGIMVATKGDKTCSYSGSGSSDDD
jgi:serine/threonine protein kinase